MPRNSVATRKRILTAAYRLFYRRGYVRVTMDDISTAARITKRSVYYHFKSKDDLVRAALQDQQAHILPLIQKWVREPASSPATLLSDIFTGLRRWVAKPGWIGSGYTRLAMELADLPGHPAREIGRQHKLALEEWLTARLADAGARNAKKLARATLLLMEGTMLLVLLHNDPSYASTAEMAAIALVKEKF